MSDKLIEILLAASGWGVAALIAIVGLTHMDNLVLFFSRLASVFKWIGTGVKKKTVGLEIQGVVMKASKVLLKQNSNIAPYGLKIEWVKQKDMDTFIEENRVVVRMSDARKSNRNLIWAINEYARHGVVPYAKHHMSNVLRDATDLVVSKILLTASCNYALPLFYEEIYKTYKKDPRLDRTFHDLIRVDDNGILTRIYLNEIAKISDVLLNSERTEATTKELKDFTSFMIDIATKERGEHVKLYYHGALIDIAVILAAADFSQDIAERNIRLIEKYLGGRCKTVYILAIGIKTIIAEQLIEAIDYENKFICYSKKNRYIHRFSDGTAKDGICIEINTYSDEFDEAIGL